MTCTLLLCKLIISLVVSKTSQRMPLPEQRLIVTHRSGIQLLWHVNDQKEKFAEKSQSPQCIVVGWLGFKAHIEWGALEMDNEEWGRMEPQSMGT